MRAKIAATVCTCRQWDEDIVPLASKLLLDEIQLAAGSPGGMEAYRCSLVISFFFKFYLTIRLKLEEKLVSFLVYHCRHTPLSAFLSAK